MHNLLILVNLLHRRFSLLFNLLQVRRRMQSLRGSSFSERLLTSTPTLRRSSIHISRVPQVRQIECHEQVANSFFLSSPSFHVSSFIKLVCVCVKIPRISSWCSARSKTRSCRQPSKNSGWLNER